MRLRRRTRPTASRGLPDDVRILRPRTLAEARDAVRDLPGALMFAGSGTKADWGAPPERLDGIVTTAALDQLAEHRAGDLIAVVGAGMPLAKLNAALAGARQQLALDPPFVDEGATVGGIVAANDAGPRRLRYGAPRDLVLGMTVVLADGTVARTGGKVVKNVAGFDLARLFTGSLGTLGLIAEIVLRLHPLPERSRTLRVSGPLASLAALAWALGDSPVAPSAVDLADGALWVRCEGRPQAVAARADAACHLAAAHGADEVELLDGPDEDAAWERITTGHGGDEGDTVVRVAALPDRLVDVSRAAADAAEGAHRVTSHAASGLHDVVFGPADPAVHARAVGRLRRAISPLGGTLVVRRRAVGVDGLVDPWLDPAAPPPSALPLMRAVKHALDPDRRCAPGRQIGGI